MLLLTWCGCDYSLTVSPLPVRAAWWQPTLLIHVAWVRRVSNEKQGAPLDVLPPALVVRGAGRGFSIIPAGFGCEVGMDAWVVGWRWESYILLLCR